MSGKQKVLILVVMEYTQWVEPINKKKYEWVGLNPCCNGIYSMSEEKDVNIVAHNVLILVVMEYTQWVIIELRWELEMCLNPCCNGIYSMRLFYSQVWAYKLS